MKSSTTKKDTEVTLSRISRIDTVSEILSKIIKVNLDHDLELDRAKA